MSFDNVTTLESTLELTPESILASFGPREFIALALVALFSLVLAFHGFKLLRFLVVLSGATVGYSLGSYNLAMLIGDKIPIARIDIILGVILAIVAALVSFKVYKAVIFLEAALGAYFAGVELFDPMLSGMADLPIAHEVLVAVASVMYAIVIAFIVYKFFKPIYIVSSAIAGMFLFAVCVCMPLELISAGLFENVVFYAVIVSFVIGIIAAIKQFKACRDIEF